MGTVDKEGVHLRIPHDDRIMRQGHKEGSTVAESHVFDSSMVNFQQVCLPGLPIVLEDRQHASAGSCSCQLRSERMGSHTGASSSDEAKPRHPVVPELQEQNGGNTAARSRATTDHNITAVACKHCTAEGSRALWICRRETEYMAVIVYTRLCRP
jgi:hypothetical protein